jgi:hypothetical protein
VVVQWVSLCLLEMRGRRQAQEPREDDPLIERGRTGNMTEGQDREQANEPSRVEWIEMRVFGSCFPGLRDNRGAGEED